MPQPGPGPYPGQRDEPESLHSCVADHAEGEPGNRTHENARTEVNTRGKEWIAPASDRRHPRKKREQQGEENEDDGAWTARDPEQQENARLCPWFGKSVCRERRRQEKRKQGEQPS